MTEEFVKCVECGDEVEEFDVVITEDGDAYCIKNGCDEVVYNCEDCGYNYLVDEGTYLEAYGKWVCDECIDASYVLTNCCNEYIHDYDTVITEDDGAIYCEADCAYDNGAFTCYGCDELLSEGVYSGCDDYGDPLCQSCYNENYSEHIRGYGNNPSINFFGNPSNKRYFGVELELDYGDAIGFADDINETTDERLYLMEDGSLERGVEVISQPMDLHEHLNGGMWEDVRKYARKHELKSHDTSTCGLHIHVSRDGLLHGDDTVDNIVFIVERFWKQMAKFSRRTEYNLNRWAERYMSEKDPSLVFYDDVKKKRKRGRYSAINLSPSETIEFRFFRGTLKLETLFASLELVDYVCNLAEQLNDKQLDMLTWSEFVDGISSEYMYLVDYIREREIMPNDEECKATIALRETAKVNIVLDKARKYINKLQSSIHNGVDMEWFNTLSNVLSTKDYESLRQSFDTGDKVVITDVDNNPFGRGSQDNWGSIGIITEPNIYNPYEENYASYYADFYNHRGYALPESLSMRVNHTNYDVVFIMKDGRIIHPVYVGWREGERDSLIMITDITVGGISTIPTEVIRVDIDEIDSMTISNQKDGIDGVNSVIEKINKLIDNKDVDGINELLDNASSISDKSLENSFTLSERFPCLF